MAPSGSSWFSGGLRFACTRCGRCCTGPGYVWLSAERISRIAAFLGLAAERFSRRYVRRVDNRLSLVEQANGDCVFWDREEGCTIYEERPRQCRTFPFWREHLKSAAAWRALADECPGVDGRPLHDEEEILHQLGRG